MVKQNCTLTVQGVLDPLMLYTLREVTISTSIFQRRKMKLISLRGLSNVALIPTQVTSYSQVGKIYLKQTNKKTSWNSLQLNHCGPRDLSF